MKNKQKILQTYFRPTIYYVIHISLIFKMQRKSYLINFTKTYSFVSRILHLSFSIFRSASNYICSHKSVFSLFNHSFLCTSRELYYRTLCASIYVDIHNIHVHIRIYSNLLNAHHFSSFSSSSHNYYQHELSRNIFD